MLEVEYKTWQPQERTYLKKEEFNRRDTSAVLPPREKLEIPEESFNWDEKSFIQPPTAGPDGKTPSPKEAEELWRKGWQYSSSALNDYPSPDRPTIRPYGTGNPGEGAGVSPDPREKRRTPARGSKWVLPVVIGEVALILIVILVLSRLGLL